MNELPSHWLQRKLADVCYYIQRGKSPKYDLKSSIYPVVNQKCIRWEGIQEKDLKFVSEDFWNNLDSIRVLRKGDILWNSTGTGTIGRAAIYSGLNGYSEATADSHVTILRSMDGLDSKYLYYWIKSPFVQDKIEEMQTGSTNQVELSKKAIESALIYVAPLKEQEKIVTKLDIVFEEILNIKLSLDKISSKLKLIRKNILNSLFLGSIISEDFSLGKKVNIRDIITDVNNGLSKRKSMKGLPRTVLRLADYKNGRRVHGNERAILLDEKEIIRYSLMAGDILVVRVNGSKAIAGQFYLYDKSDEEAYCDHFIKLSVNKELIEPKFLSYLAQSTYGRSYVESRLVTTAGQQTINQPSLLDFPFYLPSKSKQIKAIIKAEELLTLTDELEKTQISLETKLNNLNRSILMTAFKGKLVKADPEYLTVNITSPVHMNEKKITPIKKSKIKKGSIMTLLQTDILPTHLHDLLKKVGPLPAEDLWKESKLEINDFYEQLKEEENSGLLKEKIQSDEQRVLEAI